MSTAPYAASSDNAKRLLDSTYLSSNFRQRRSNQIAQNVYAETLAGAQEEPWPNTTAWFPTSAAQVSGGMAFAPAANNTQPMTRTGFIINPNQNVRLEAIMKVVVNANSTYSLIGFSTDGSAVTPATGLANVAAAIGVFNNQAIWVSGGVARPIVPPFTTLPTLSSSTYKVVVEADENGFSGSIAVMGGSTNIWHSEVAFPARSSFGSVIPWMLLEDNALTAGSGFGLISIKSGFASSRKGFGISPQANLYSWTTNTMQLFSAGVHAQAMVVAPRGYDSRIPYPAVLCFHSSGGRLNDYLTNPQKIQTTLALLNAGYILILACSNASNDSTWGCQGALDSYTAAYKWARDHFNIGSLCFLGTSMGGIESLLALAERQIPDVVAWAGISPTYSQLNCYAFGGGLAPAMPGPYGATQDTLSAPLTAGVTSMTTADSYSAGMQIFLGTLSPAEIVTATANSTGSGPFVTAITATKNAHASGAVVSNFPWAIIGNNGIGSPTPGGLAVRDPAQLPATAFRGVPMLILTATDDQTVPPAANGFALAAAVQGVSTEVLVYPGLTGDHAFVPSTDVINTLVTFFNRYTGN